MFDTTTYIQRRRELKKKLGKGVVLFVGNEECARNYPANTFEYRQDSNFLYFLGLNFPGLAAVLDLDENRDIVFGNDLDMDDIIWMGPQPLLADRCSLIGITETRPAGDLGPYLAKVQKQGRKIHFLPPYRPDKAIFLEKLLGIRSESLHIYSSLELILAIAKLRSHKSDEEVAEIEKALAVSYDMYETARRIIRPGAYESDIRGLMEGLALSRGVALAFPPIVTIHGETLHNHHYGNRLEEGQLLLVDSGAESPLFYASDITRTYPVSGKYTDRQKTIYSAVLEAQKTAISLCKPDIKHRDVHLAACQTLAGKLKDAGLMKGDPAAAVAAGAHALFMPHGLGHMMGLDVHDMEDMGEKYIGYDQDTTRSDQFGLAYLRLAKKLEAGFVFTCEPGCYFIPELIDRWHAEKKHLDFINYEEVEKYRTFGGIRIEDNIAVTPQGCRVLGKPIPKEIAEIEKG